MNKSDEKKMACECFGHKFLVYSLTLLPPHHFTVLFCCAYIILVSRVRHFEEAFLIFFVRAGDVEAHFDPELISFGMQITFFFGKESNRSFWKVIRSFKQLLKNPKVWTIDS